MEIVNVILMNLPAILALLVESGVFISIKSFVKESIKIIKESKELQEIKNQYNQILQENYELKRDIKKILEVSDKIKRS